MIIFISTVVLVLGIILGMWGWGEKNDDLITISVMAIVASIAVGFGLLGGLVPTGETKEQLVIPEQISKSEFTVFAKIENTSIFSTDAKFVLSPIDKIMIKKEDSCNAYGFVLNTRYTFSLKD